MKTAISAPIFVPRRDLPEANLRPLGRDPRGEDISNSEVPYLLVTDHPFLCFPSRDTAWSWVFKLEERDKPVWRKARRPEALEAIGVDVSVPLELHMNELEALALKEISVAMLLKNIRKGTVVFCKPWCKKHGTYHQAFVCVTEDALLKMLFDLIGRNGLVTKWFEVGEPVLASQLPLKDAVNLNPDQVTLLELSEPIEEGDLCAFMLGLRPDEMMVLATTRQQYFACLTPEATRSALANKPPDGDTYEWFIGNMGVRSVMKIILRDILPLF